MLSPNQVHVLLDILDRQILLFVGRTMGTDVLSDDDKRTLLGYGIYPEQLYEESKDLVKLNFQLGMLSNILASQTVKDLTVDQLTSYIKSGKYIPLNQRERATINNIKMQSLADIKSTRNRIFQDINNVVGQVTSSNRSNQEEYLRGQIVEGTENRQSRKTIARNIARATGDWSRNFDKSVAYISHTALNEGRAAMIERRYEGNDAKIYFQVQIDACSKCKGLYLKDGSEPIVFLLKDLQANGNNIGRKQADWKPTLSALHVHCRCLATEFIEGMVWNGEKFQISKENRPKSSLNRPKIRIEVDGVEHFV